MSSAPASRPAIGPRFGDQIGNRGPDGAGPFLFLRAASIGPTAHPLRSLNRAPLIARKQRPIDAGQDAQRIAKIHVLQHFVR
jgi:hypothetical protein